MNGPPRLAAILLRLTLRNADAREGVLGDLHEELERCRLRPSPPRHPSLWYWWAILRLTGCFAFQSWPRGTRSSNLPFVDVARNRWPRLGDVVQELRVPLRALRKSPGFAAVAVLTLALGIGANVAMFSVVEPTLLRPLPYADGDRLVLGLGTVEGESWTQTVSAHDYVDLWDRSSAFESLAARTAWPWIGSVTGGEEPLRLQVAWVTVNLFRTLGVDPVVGRHFGADEGVAGAPNVALVSHALWQQNLGSDPNVVGRSVAIDGDPVTIVGVMPAGFGIWQDADVWLPMRLGEAFAGGRRYQNFVMIGRLGHGVSLVQAQSQADVVGAELAAAYPATNSGEGFRFRELQDALTERYRTSLLLLLGGVALLLLIACGNLAALLLARGFTRQTEFSVRVALGASRRRLLRHVLAESLAVSLAGGALGTVLALALHGVMLAYIPFDLPVAAEAGLSVPLLLFALSLSMATGALIGIVPGIRAVRREAMEGLKLSGRTSDGWGTRFRSGLVVAQVALSTVLLVGSGLLVRSFVHLRTVETGFDTEGLWAADLELPRTEYPGPEERVAFFAGLEERIRALPGVEDVAMINRLPVRTGGGNTAVYPLGERPPRQGQARTANERWVRPGYFTAMRIPLLRGRAIDPRDGPNAMPVLVINQAMADQFFPGEDPLGRIVIVDFDEETLLEVVGVVGDVRFSGPAGSTFPAMYRSYAQEPVTRMAIGLRIVGDPSSVVAGLKQAVRDLDPTLPISSVETMDHVLARTIGDRTVVAVTLTGFALIALLLSVLGLYGVLAYYVSQRVPELGLRIALGADARRVVRLVTTRGLQLLALGMALGIAGAYGATRLLQQLLFGVQPTDPSTFVTISASLALAGCAACVLPAWRAARVDPVRALQAE